MGIQAPQLSYDDLRRRAEAFLLEHHSSGHIPVPIEEIVEFHFKMDIVPVPGLHQSFAIDSYISSDLREIRVDEFVYQSRPGRYRFSLCHELGHLILHEEAFSQLAFRTISEWKEAMQNAIPEREYRFFEWQASSFAGLVLVPRQQLVEKYAEVSEMVEKNNLSRSENFEVFREAAADYIAKYFEVSAAVVARRLEDDNIWPKSRR